MNLDAKTLRIALSLSLLLALLAAGAAQADDWPAWRGPLANGVSAEKGLPVKWSPTENVRWRLPLPAPGNSTPIVWGDRVFLTQAEGKQRSLLCINRADGKVLWRQGVTTRLAEDPPTHGTNPYCSPSPVTDGRCVIVWHGSDGLHCYDLAGKPLWSRDLGVQRHTWGYGSSPVIRGGLCYLNFGPGNRTILMAVDTATGKTVWQHEEPSAYGKPPPDGKGKPMTYVGSWATPVIAAVDGRDQVLLSWPRRLAAYDPATGREIWTCTGLGPLVYPSPLVSGDTVVAMSGFSGAALAVRAGGEGDVTAARRLWHVPRTPQRIGSGVIHEGHIYIHNDPGTAQCLEAATGKVVWEERLRGSGKSGQNWSSVLLADGKCYTITQGGDCFVFKAAPAFELLAVNPLGERSNSSVVASNGDLFIRTHAALWCVGGKK